MKLKNAEWIGIGAALAVVAGIVWMWKNTTSYHGEKPPKGAPQLDLENPGSQDDFPKPPMESEIG